MDRVNQLFLPAEYFLSDRIRNLESIMTNIRGLHQWFQPALGRVALAVGGESGIPEILIHQRSEDCVFLHPLVMASDVYCKFTRRMKMLHFNKFMACAIEAKYAKEFLISGSARGTKMNGVDMLARTLHSPDIEAWGCRELTDEAVRGFGPFLLDQQVVTKGLKDELLELVIRGSRAKARMLTDNLGTHTCRIVGTTEVHASDSGVASGDEGGYLLLQWGHEEIQYVFMHARSIRGAIYAVVAPTEPIKTVAATLTGRATVTGGCWRRRPQGGAASVSTASCFWRGSGGFAWSGGVCGNWFAVDGLYLARRKRAIA
jgi:hypothetical protein